MIIPHNKGHFTKFPNRKRATIFWTGLVENVMKNYNLWQRKLIVAVKDIICYVERLHFHEKINAIFYFSYSYLNTNSAGFRLFAAEVPLDDTGPCCKSERDGDSGALVELVVDI